MSNYFSQWPELRLLRRDGSTVPASEALGSHAYILLYLGARWNASCRAFNAELKSFFDKNHKEKNFTVLYIGRDRTEEEAMQGFLKKRNDSDDDSDDCHGDYYALQFSDMTAVAEPLLHYFRVFAYPSVLVLDNRNAKELLLEGGSDASASSTAIAAKRSSFFTITPQSAEEAAARDSRGQLKYTPRIPHRKYEPRVVTTLGCYMIPKDPMAELFPWAELGAEMQRERRWFAAIAVALLCVVVAVMWKYVFAPEIARRKK